MKKFHLLFLVALFAAFLLHFPALLLAQTEGEPPVAPEQKVKVAAPDLADIIPLASNLSGRQAQLKNKIKMYQEYLYQKR